MFSFSALAGHPIHAMLVAFPIALLYTVFLLDVLYYLRRSAFWARCSYVTLVMALAWCVPAAATGLLDYLLHPMVRLASWHLRVGLGLLLLTSIHLQLRRPRGRGTMPRVRPALSVLTVMVVTVQGYLGGELVYHYHVGISPGSGATVGGTDLKQAPYQTKWDAAIDKRPAPIPTVSPGEISEARAAFQQHCMACHRLREMAGGDQGPDLSREGARHSRQWIIVQIRDPAAHRSAAQMPPVSLSERDLQAISGYLSSLQ